MYLHYSGKDYESHIKCITEEQRYSGKGFVAKEKKGELKQNIWVEMVQSVLDEQKNAPKNVIKIIETVSKHTNTPRKKPKFINFVKNVCGNRTNPKEIEAAWDLISVKLLSLTIDQNKNCNQNQQKKNGEIEENNEQEINEETEQNHEVNKEVSEEIKTKKQKKEEKKRKKYEAELQSAAAPPEEVVEEIKLTKKEKKIKNKIDVNEASVVNNECEEKKNKKRKRLDTINSENEDKLNGHSEIGKEQIADVKIVKLKKKKQEPDVEEADESLCLHDKNVAKGDEIESKKEKFDWHKIIQTVLEKKGGEMPFKRLQKKVLGEYSEVTGNVVDDRIAEKFMKKLKGASDILVDKNRVILKQ